MVKNDRQKTTEKETETAATFTEELTAVLEEIKRRTCKRKEKREIVTIVNETDIQIGEREYRIVKIIVMPLILNA